MKTLASCLLVLASLSNAPTAVAAEDDNIRVLAPDTPAELTGRGNAAYQAQQFDRAINLYKRAIDKDKSYVYAYFNLGLIYQQRGEFDIAKQYYEEALKIQPENPQAFCNLGYISFHNKDYRGAITNFTNAANSASNRNEDTALYYFNLGTAHEHLREWHEAEKAYQNALLYDAQAFDVHFNLGTLYLSEELNNPSRAEQHLRLANTIAPKRPEPLLNLAVLAEKAGRIEEVEGYYNDAVRWAPTRSRQLANALWKRAQFYDRSIPPRKIDMKRDLIAILDIDEFYPGVNGKLGMYFESLADYERAIEYLSKEVAGEHFDETSGLDLECHYLLSQIYTEHKINATKALEHARTYYTLRPNSLAAKRLHERVFRINEGNNGNAEQ